MGMGEVACRPDRVEGHQEVELHRGVGDLRSQAGRAVLKTKKNVKLLEHGESVGSVKNSPPNGGIGGLKAPNDGPHEAPGGGPPDDSYWEVI